MSKELTITANQEKVLVAIFAYACSNMGGKTVKDLREDNYSWFKPSDLKVEGLTEKQIEGVVGSLKEQYFITEDPDYVDGPVLHFLDYDGINEVEKIFKKHNITTVNEINVILNKKESESVMTTTEKKTAKTTSKNAAKVDLKNVPVNEVTEPVEFNKETKSNFYKIDPRALVFGDNPRVDYGDMESLKESIRENGVLEPIKVRKHKEDDGTVRYQVKHGNRRGKAVMMLLEEGVDVARIPAVFVTKDYTEESELLDHFILNSGKPMTPYEEAVIFNKLEKMGWTQMEISKKIGKTPTHISNMIKISKTPKKIRDAMAAGYISTSLVLELMYQYKDDAEQVILDAIAIAKDLGLKKVTNKTAQKTTTAKKNAPVSKQMKKINAALENVVEDEEVEKLEKAKEIIRLVEDTQDTDVLVKKLMDIL